MIPSFGGCAASDGHLVDIVLLDLNLVGMTPGTIEEGLLVLPHYGGMGQQTRTITVRTNAPFSDLDVTPDPISFPETFIGFAQRQVVELVNAGTAPLTVTDFRLVDTSTFAPDIGVNGVSLTLDPMGSAMTRGRARRASMGLSGP